MRPYQTLLAATQMNNPDMVRDLLKKGVDPNLEGTFNFSYNDGENVYIAASTHGLAAAFFAIAHGYEDIIDIFLHNNLNLDSRRFPHTNPLEAAVLSGKISILKKLIEQRADINAQNHYGKTALYVAVDEGFLDAAQILLKYGALPDLQENDLSWAPLHRCCFHGSTDMVVALLKHKANPHLKTNDEDTPMHLASWKNHPEVIKILVEAGASVNDKRKQGQTPLHVAVTYNSLQAAIALISYGADVMATDDQKQTPLHCVSITEDIEFAELLIQNGADINAVNENGDTPLHCCAVKGSSQMFKFLMSKGADPFKIGWAGYTSLHNATTNGHKGIVKAILAMAPKRHELDATDKESMTALGCTITHDNVEILQILLDSGADPFVKYRPKVANTLLHWAAFNNSFKCLKFLLEHKVIPVNCCNSHGTTPLHVASMRGNLNIIDLLLKFGADPLMITDNEENVLHLALIEKKTEVAEFYLKNAICPAINDQNQHGATPLNIAAEKNNIEGIKLLLKYKADPLRCNCYGRTPLHYAASIGDIEMAKLLLKAVGNKNKIEYINAKTKEWWTALHMAAEFQHLDFALFLIREGACVNATNKDGYTPLHMCAKTNIDKMFKLLLGNGALISSKTHTGTTVLHVAASCKSTSLVQLILSLDPSQRDALENPHNATPLISALSQGHEEVAHLLLDAGSDLNIETSIWRDTPLDFAAHSGLYEAVHRLMISGANIYHKGLMGRTALHWAAISGNVDLITELLCQGADPWVIDIHGFSAREIAEQQNQKEAASLLKWWPSLYYLNDNVDGLEDPSDIEEDFDKVPKRFICPISQNLMMDPVFAADGFAYERNFIESWLSQRSWSPLTRRPLRNFCLIPALSLSNQISVWKSKLRASLYQ